MALTPTLRIKSVIGHLVICAFVAGACFNFVGCEQTEKVRQEIDQKADETEKTLDAAKKVAHPLSYEPLTVSNKVWSGNAALRMQRGMPLPPRYEGARGVTLVSADPMSLNDISNAISAQTGIPINPLCRWAGHCPAIPYGKFKRPISLLKLSTIK